MTTDRQELSPEPIRIDLWRGVKALLWTLVIPMSLAVFVDITSGLLPWLTIVAAVICIPLATIVVNRTVLAEFSRVVALVAPEVDEPREDEQGQQRTEQAGVEGQVADDAAGLLSNDWPLGGQSLTEGAQKHHG